MSDPLAVLAGLCCAVVIAELLVRHTALRHGGTAMVVILVAAVASNLGLLPTSSTPQDPQPIYDAVFTYVAPLAIFWLLSMVDLRRVLTAGIPLLALFLLGTVGTVVGVLAGMALLGAGAFGEHTAALSGMFAATYIGGSSNFNAVALHYDVMRAPVLFAGAVAVDAGMSAIWMAVTLVWPRLDRTPTPPPGFAAMPAPDDRASIDPTGLALVLGLGVAALWLSNVLSAALTARGVPVPAMIVLTVLGLLLGQTRLEIPGLPWRPAASVLGLAAVYLFLAVIGACCDVAAVIDLGATGARLLLLVTVILIMHGIIVFGGAALARQPAGLAAIASQANIGGGTTALAVARSMGRPDLVLPAILVGSLGNALGTFVGFWVAALHGG